ncbi:protein S-acyltransferase 18 [Cannabis sativa]|uniref:protein S-acyltransferase 18 n=1 Tax=Cannabis sativa TaxID=3483 RepID=UPI0011E05333|nr:protein S-acyltransferase 18 [Cannabis sativa]XP_030497641.1 protein S-acyltransferase 18 [Cannabis sativa]XP_060962213.1 protein S-acyltransferase 18-like [Cannabis sativa]XP_060962214.1 protein S-acyltransferase 18-like [Cannabis sativa]XP_060962215.1 protein S-acyltransferase 18-like [Cannabis sativa]XP_060963843.1 protein S-acyltransferase 18 [Cannabis sativa]
MIITRRHGWQRPLHSLQIVGMAIFSFLVVAFYAFLGLFLGNRTAEITVTTIFSIASLSVMGLFIRCTAIDPTDKTGVRRKRTKKKVKSQIKLNYGFILGQIVLRFFRRVEKKILRSFIRRKYLDPWSTSSDHLDPFLPFPLVLKDDAAVNTPNPNQDDISFCQLCDMEVKKRSKHCRTCNRCVEGFDHHCRWLNNCVGKRNYTTFILLMVFVLLMLIMEGGTAVAIFVRCFTDKHGLEKELEQKLYVKFPREVLATISILLLLMTAYGSAALGQLFFFHVVLIRKGIRTYDYILAMKEENQFAELDSFDDDSGISSDDSAEFYSPEKPTFVSRFICSGQGLNQSNKNLSIRIEGDPETSLLANKQGFRVGISPWKLIKLSKEKALRAAERARERIVKQKPMMEQGPLKPLPSETKCGPLMNKQINVPDSASGLTPLVSNGRLGGSPGRFSSPRRRFSCPPSTVSSILASPQQKYRSNFDLKLTDVSKELETYISRQVLCSVIKEDGSQPSPR